MNSTIGHLQAEENRKPLPETSIGGFVRSTSNDLGTGKIIAADGTTVEIEYFDSVGADGRVRRHVDRDTVLRVRIPCQTRCWFEQDGVWQTGRVIELLDSRYSIFLPSQKLAILPESEFYVRWDRPVRDPMEVMVANAFDTPLYHELRRPFIDEMLRQRAACQGMTAIVSSVAGLYAHQLDVVARVLVDDRQRYVLADEVGLGKTIEAGMIVRQWLLDKPSDHVLVAVPKFLVRQWRDELDSKFNVSDFGDNAVRVVEHGSLNELNSEPPDLLVVDEAHVLMPWAGFLAEAHEYAALRAVAGGSRGLLLLSATPLLHNEAAFLAMLHLLDPVAYDLGDLEGFKNKVRDRQSLALRVNGLTTTAPDFLLERHVNHLISQYPEDLVLAELAQPVKEALASGRPSDFALRLHSLREHVHDTYRLHRRVLRNRRGSDRTRAFRVRGRAGITRLVTSEDARLSVNDWLDEWRLQVVVDQGVTAESSQLLLLVLECSGSDLKVLQEALQLRLGVASEPYAYLTADQAAELRRLPVTEAESWALERGLAALAGLQVSDSRVDQVVELLGDMPSAQKAVIFTGFTGIAKALGTAIATAYGKQCVALHLDDMDPNAVESEIERVQSLPTCQFLICDSSAEAGRNFQWADRIVHVDLPWSPNRLEQRVGRLDRYANGPEVLSTVFADQCPGSFADAWLECLCNGFRVFGKSIASLQHPVDEAMHQLALAVLSEGIGALVEATAELPQRLDKEQLDVESLDALESISEEGEFRRDLYERIMSSDGRWQARQRAAEDWIAEKPGNLRFHREIEPDETRRYLTHPPNRRPKAENLPLVPWDVLARVFEPRLDRPGTYTRDKAMRRPGSRLFGVGDPFIDALTHYSRWDTRGQAFGMWRRRRTWLGRPEVVAFRLDFVASASIEAAMTVLGEAASSDREIALRRLCEPYFPPFVHTIWVDTQGSEIEEASILRVLQQPYEPARGDAHLSPGRRWALDTLLPRGWTPLCNQIRAAGETIVRSGEAVTTVSEQAVARAETALAVLLSRNNLRRRAASAEVDADEFGWLSEALVAAIKDGLKEPQLVLDAVGCVVIAGTFPDGWHGE